MVLQQDEQTRAADVHNLLSQTLMVEMSRSRGVETSLSVSLQQQISTDAQLEASARQALEQEISRAKLSESVYSAAMQSKIMSASTSEVSLASALVVEVSRAVQIEASIAAATTAEMSRALGAELSLSAWLSANLDISRSSAAFQMNTALGGEISRSLAALGGNSIALNTEISVVRSRQGSIANTFDSFNQNNSNFETSFNSFLQTEISRSTSTETSAAAFLASFHASTLETEESISVTASINGVNHSDAMIVLQSALANKALSSRTAESDLVNLLEAETLRATLADATELSRAQSVEASLATSVAEESSRGLNARQVLSSSLAAEISRAAFQDAVLLQRAQDSEATLAGGISTEKSLASFQEMMEEARAVATETVLEQIRQYNVTSLASQLSAMEFATVNTINNFATVKANLSQVLDSKLTVLEQLYSTVPQVSSQVWTGLNTQADNCCGTSTATLCASNLTSNRLEEKISLLMSNPLSFSAVGLSPAQLSIYNTSKISRLDITDNATGCVVVKAYLGASVAASFARRSLGNPIGAVLASIVFAEANGTTWSWSVYSPPYTAAPVLGNVSASTGISSSGSSLNINLILLLIGIVLHIVWLSLFIYRKKKHEKQEKRVEALQQQLDRELLQAKLEKEQEIQEELAERERIQRAMAEADALMKASLEAKPEEAPENEFTVWVVNDGPGADPWMMEAAWGEPGYKQATNQVLYEETEESQSAGAAGKDVEYLDVASRRGTSIDYSAAMRRGTTAYDSASPLSPVGEYETIDNESSMRRSTNWSQDLSPRYSQASPLASPASGYRATTRDALPYQQPETAVPTNVVETVDVLFNTAPKEFDDSADYFLESSDQSD